MLLNFFLAFQALDSYGGLVWIVDQRRVIAHYLRGWWAFDALTIFVPLGFDLSIAFAPVDEYGNAATSSFAVYAVTRRSMAVRPEPSDGTRIKSAWDFSSTVMARGCSGRR